ncbi:hypothetical protein HMF8227_03009 [Saliniradius amylolyticus]|uniref:STAS domain-containing protein n=1 Tax=Saliniradius amylolyticus TaxID=2183582 RepID=A0A2S2E963_9ALTE|nr:STAS domain-containing protein [Saliniradius amylolyticus]AWL13457.1 hypothetical protein HMF8227_03009 [Saliniradius amylolyticus]
MSTSNHILFARQQKMVVFKLVGELRHTDSLGLDSLIQEVFVSCEKPAVQEVLVDLSESRYMDSTILGLLAMIARLSIKKLGHKASLLCTNQDVLAILNSMCLDQVFILIGALDQAETGVEYQSVDSLTSDEKARARVILEAHRSLMNLSESNKATFQPVVELMKQELES